MNKNLKTYNTDMFNEILEEYDIHQGDIIYSTIKNSPKKLSDMDNNYIKLKLNECIHSNMQTNSNNIQSSMILCSLDAWIHVFNLELNKRRMNKLNKVISNIK